MPSAGANVSSSEHAEKALLSTSGLTIYLLNAQVNSLERMKYVGVVNYILDNEAPTSKRLSTSTVCECKWCRVLLFRCGYKASYYNLSFVCFLCTLRSFDGSSPNLVCVCRLTSHLPLRGSFSKRSTGHFRFPLCYICGRLTPHHCKKHTAYDSRQHQTHATPLTKAHGIFCSLETG